MTHLNWQRSDLNRVQSDDCGDDLPRVGSRADMARNLEAGRGNERGFSAIAQRGTRVSQRPLPSPSRTASVSNRDADLRDLKAYIANATAGDFARRPAVQRADVVRALVVLSGRLFARNCPPLDSRESALLAQASTLVAKWRVTR